MQIAAHAKQILTWKPNDIHQVYSPVELGTPIDFNPDFPSGKIEIRKVRLEVSGLHVSVSLEFIRLLMAPVRLTHPLQAAHRVAIVYREDDDTRYSTEYDTSVLQEALDVL